MEKVADREMIYESSKTYLYVEERALTNEKVLIKVLREGKDDSRSLVQFYNEYELTHQLKIPGVRKALEKTQDKGQHALVLEYVEGSTLKEAFLDKERSLKEFLQVAIKIARALGLLHQHNIIHKDINPNNILFNEKDGQVHIIDFNFSSLIDIKQQHLENPGLLEGTLRYISPEQTGRMNRVVDYRTDLYSLGITFYELLGRGQLPYLSEDMLELLHMHMAKVPVPLHKIRPEVPETISAIVSKLMAKNAEDRYQSAFGLQHDLEQCLASLESSNKIEAFPLAVKDFSARFKIPQKLYGRKEEVASLMEAFRVASEGALELVLVQGLSGTGKSALVNEVHKPITGKKGFFISGKFDQFQRNNPYYAISQAFKSFCNILLTENEETLALWKTRLLEALGSNGAVLTDIIPQLELVIGKQAPVSELGAGEAQNRLHFVFRSFVEAIARAEHPLVLFIDDLQWADAASLNLLRMLLAQSGQGHVLVILSYRDNEVAESHPFQQMIDKLQEGKLHISRIRLENLSEAHVQQLLADTFREKPENVSEVAAMVYERTQGNAFFVNQFLLSLYEEGCLQFKAEENKWAWDLAEIRQMQFSDNVVDLMTAKAQKLDLNTQESLQLAACMGNIFSLDQLTAIQQQKPRAIATALKEALKEGLILPLSDQYKLLDGTTLTGKVEFKFVHDRVQQALYEMLGQEEKAKAHLQIARLLDRPEEPLQEENVFDLVNQYNKASHLFSSEVEQLRVAGLNAKAARKAKLSSAYEPALQYAREGLKLVNEQHWQEHHALLFQLYLERAETEHLCGNDAAAAQFFDIAIEKAQSQQQIAYAYEKKIHYYTNIGSFKEAYASGSEVLLNTFKVKLPQQPSKPGLILNMLKTRSKFRKKPIRAFVDHPTAEAEEVVLAVKLIAAVLKSAYQIKPELAVASSMVMVNLCMKKGNTEDSPIGYLVFGGIFLGGILGMRKLGNQFGQLSRDLIEKYRNATQKSEVTFVYGYFASSWLFPLQEAEEYFQKAYEYGLETGDMFHTGCSCSAMLQHHMMRGAPLPEVLKKAEAYKVLLSQQGGNPETIGTVKAIGQAVQCLQRKTKSLSTFEGNGFVEVDYENEAGHYVSQHFAHYYYINKMTCLYLAGELEEAAEMAKASARHLDPSQGMLHSTEHFFYEGLIHAALALRDESNKSRGKLKTALDKFESWAKKNPSNFAAKKALLRAEYLRLRKKPWEASLQYLEAIKYGREQGFKHIMAMAYEKLSALYSEQGKAEEATLQMQQALRMYQQWGAEAKVDLLAEGLPAVVRDASISFGSSSSYAYSITGVHEVHSLDVHTILKSAQVLSGEVVLGRLLDKMMKLVIENAGAQQGYLILHQEEDQAWYVQAHGSLDTEEVEVLQQIPLHEVSGSGEEACLSAAIVNYVMRSREYVILNDAAGDGDFTEDAYVKRHQHKSILCMPLIYKGKITGVLYLENKLATGAFTSRRIEVLNMLTTQMAISIENAMLYENLEEKVRDRTAEVVKQKEIIEKKNEDITASIKYAKQIQNAMLPTDQTIRAGFEQIFILFMPRDIVSGDFYWYGQKDDKTLIAAVDCTGHGVPGAFMSLVGESNLNQAVQQQGNTEPGKILDLLHQGVNKTLKQNETDNQDGMDAALCTIDHSRQTISFSGAKNPLVKVNAKGELVVIKGDKLSIGGKREGQQGQVFTTHVAPVEKGSTYYLFSDGYADQFGGPTNTKFMIGKFKKLLQQIAPLPMQEQHDILKEKFESWKAGHFQVDDVLVIGFRL